MTRAKPQSRRWLDQIEPYQPGVKALDGVGSLAANEAPRSPGVQVQHAVADAASELNRYPDPLATPLRHALAQRHQVNPDQILVGNGSDELIFLLATAFAAQGGQIVCASPAYRIDEISALVVNAGVVKVALRDWQHNLERMAEVKADIAYVVNPHNPTGTTRSLDDLTRFVEQSLASLIVIDEAYIDFADPQATASALPLAREGRALVLRTFSKVYGLAGARIGYLVGNADIIATLRKIRAPFSVSSLAQAAALAALADEQTYRYTVEQNSLYRDQLKRMLEAAGLTVVPSQANFLLIVTNDEEGLVRQFADGGVMVRPGRALGLPGTVRITVPDLAGLQRVSKCLGVTLPTQAFSSADPLPEDHQ